MSAINVFTYADGAAIWTDGAAYLADGTLGGLMPKVQILAHLNAVIAARGPSLFLPIVAAEIPLQFDTFDEMRRGLSTAVRLAYGQHSDLFGACSTGPEFDLVLVGWSEETGQCQTWFLSSQDRGQHAAWRMHRMGPVLITPYDEGLGAVLALTEAQLAGSLHPIDDGLRIIEAQRGVKAIQGRETEPSHGVGGFAQYTALSSDLVLTRVIRRWRDVVGERLGPSSSVHG